MTMRRPDVVAHMAKLGLEATDDYIGGLVDRFGDSWSPTSGSRVLTSAGVEAMDAFLASDGDVEEGDGEGARLYGSLFYNMSDGIPSDEIGIPAAVRLVEDGTIDDDTMVFANGMADWTVFGECKEEFNWPRAE